MTPIGILHTPWKTLKDCPRNGHHPTPPPRCEAHIHNEFLPGLAGLETFTHLILLYHLHLATPADLVFTPPFHHTPRGVFATRAPRRPNPIGLAIVAFDGLLAPNRLALRFLDCVDGTPLLDIKPYLPSTDAVPGASMGWLKE